MLLMKSLYDPDNVEPLLEAYGDFKGFIKVGILTNDIEQLLVRGCRVMGNNLSFRVSLMVHGGG